jgi:hypothetical protein
VKTNPEAHEISMTEPSESPATVRVETCIGTLSLLPQRFEDIGAFSKLPPDASPSSRLRLYLPYLAAPSGAAIEGGSSPRIDEASIQQLSDEDLERIASSYLSMPEMQQIAEDVSSSSSSNARADGESATAYLDRLLRANHERQMEDLKGTYEHLRDRSGQPLSSALDAVDRQASSLRDVATNFMQSHDRAERERRSELGPDPLSSSLESNLPWLSSDGEIADRANRVRDEEITLMRGIGIVTTQSAVLVASLSETATQFLRQFSETTQQSDEAARKSMRTVLIIVLIVGLFAVIAAATAIVGYLEERENRQIANQWQESVLRSVKETAAAQAAQIQSLNDQIRELNDRQTALTAAPPPSPETGAGQKAASETEASSQSSPKPGSVKRTSKRKATRGSGSGDAKG